MSELEPDSFFKFTQLVCMTQLKLDDPTDGSHIGVDFQKIYEQIVSLTDGRKELIQSENPASKTPTEIVAEVRAFLKNNVPEKFGEADVTVIDEPFSDDYFNVVEVACAIRHAET